LQNRIGRGHVIAAQARSLKPIAFAPQPVLIAT
jgi:hypothetical protein